MTTSSPDPGFHAPPAPLLVGVTGHRFLAQVEKLQVAVGAALDRLGQAFPGAAPIALSPLAEGADRLVAAAVLDRNPGGLIAVLPLPQDDYEQDFGPGSVAEFRALLARAGEVRTLGPTSTRNAAYAQVGDYLADTCDALIALWDGQGAQGQGGTAEVVARAIARGVPVMHIMAGNRRPGAHEPTSLGADQGRLVVHNLPRR